VTTDRAVRTLALWCPDWPVVAAGISAIEPAVIISANHVVASSAAARSEGVRLGQRRREAQSRVPNLLVVAADPARDARAFEPVVAAVEELAPGIEILQPGLAVVKASGAARYFGGEEPLVDVLAGVVADVGHEAKFGVADGTFAAVQAAYRLKIVPPGESAAFLAPLPVQSLGDADLADLLVRLGIATLGEFAALPDDEVLARFGPDGRRRHRLARGLAERPPAGREAPPDLTVESVLDPPVERVDAATFAAKALADRLAAMLAGRALVVTRVRVEAQTEHGEELARIWRHDDGFTAVALAERVRWQLDGWLSGTVGGTVGEPGALDAMPTAGVSLLRLVPIEVVGTGRQLGLWGEDNGGQERVERAVDRVLGLLGPTAVVTAVLAGGRDVAGRVHAVPWGEPRAPDPIDLLPWPGRLPVPSPAMVAPVPLPAELTDADGSPVEVSGRFVASAIPARLAVSGEPAVDVVGWAGPWPADTRWWDAGSHRRLARVQVITADDRAHLLVLESGQWRLEATYD
jgi:protein ImuB